ncbi:MAG: hypothetical protein SGBAC_010484 [Bacillariaceae sp.]
MRLTLMEAAYDIADRAVLPKRKLRSAKYSLPHIPSESTTLKERENAAQEEEIHNDDKSIQIAYVISITSCQANSTNVLDGAAILGHSIHLASKNSSYGYGRYAFVYEQEAAECVPTLEGMGWTTIVEEKLPVEIDEIMDAELRDNVNKRGCCGAKEFMKLKVYTLEDHPIAVHLDTDALLLQPMDVLYNTMLAPTATAAPGTTRTDKTLSDDHLMFHKRPTNASDFFFTRDYHQGSKWTDDPSQYGVQGGFLAVKPNRTMYQELIARLKNETYGIHKGWSGMGHSGFWGASQIQGYLSYVYKHHYPGRAVELNRPISQENWVMSDEGKRVPRLQTNGYNESYEHSLNHMPEALGMSSFAHETIPQAVPKCSSCMVSSASRFGEELETFGTREWMAL